MRVLIGVTPRPADGWDVHVTEHGGGPIARHEMEAGAERPYVRPAGSTSIDPDVVAASERLADGRPAAGDVLTVGRHLFDSLVGATAWNAIGRRLSQSRDKRLELALSWEGGEGRLQSLNWEAMHDGSTFLAGTPPPLSVSITRIVADAEFEGRKHRSVEPPIRVLFVIGSDLADERVRAGAEIMGLLRKIELERGAISSSVLQSANPESLARRVRRFHPHIVHFISHGQIGAKGEGELLLRPPGGKRTDPDLPVGADALLEAMYTEEQGHPLLAVLTGCDSGTITSDEKTLQNAHIAPLAAELVKRGIPAVVGMTGRVADRACRLFTRQFGAVLTSGKPLVDALAKGRAGGLLDAAERPANSLDWALPALYLARDLDPDYAPVKETAISVVLERIDRYSLIDAPVFCGRRRFMELFEDLIAPDGIEVLAVHTDGRRPGIGKTRLIHEMTRHALRSGHVPVLLRAAVQEGERRPTTVGRLAAEMLWAIIETRQAFDLGFPIESELLRKLEAAGRPEDVIDFAHLDPALHESRFAEFIVRDRGDLHPREMLPALSVDLTRLIADARAVEDDPTVGAESRAIVLIEGVDRWDFSAGAAAETLLSAFRRSHALGTVREPVPVVYTCALGDVAQDRLDAERQRSFSEPWNHWEPLAEFDEGGEDRVAYQWVLLNPRPEMGPLAEKVYVPRDLDDSWIKQYRISVAGFPGNMANVLFYAIAGALEQGNILVGDDERQAWNHYLSQLP